MSLVYKCIVFPFSGQKIWFLSQLVQVIFVVIDHEILPMVIPTGPLSCHVLAEWTSSSLLLKLRHLVQWKLRIPKTQKTGIFGKPNIQIDPDFFLLFSLPLSPPESWTSQKTEHFIRSQVGSVFWVSTVLVNYLTVFLGNVQWLNCDFVIIRRVYYKHHTKPPCYILSYEHRVTLKCLKLYLRTWKIAK